ncbi:MAG: MG2 domain-containing protein, partial [Candidatus Sulfotelmatobacter sp.]
MHTRWRSVSLQVFLSFFFALFLVALEGAKRPVAEAGVPSFAATFTHGILSVTVPYHSTREGSGMLTSEILDPEEHVLGRVERTVTIAKGDGSWQQIIAPAKPIAFEDLVWQRLRYRFQYEDKNVAPIAGVESISRILRRPVVRILRQSEYIAGSDVAMRILVSDAGNNDAALTGTLRAELLVPDQKPRLLFARHLNRRGTLAAQFRLPAGLTGKREIRFIADTPIGSTEYTQPVTLKDAASILLTTEKPIYQPGQTIHVRALAVDRASHRADADRNLTFEIEDSRGNKVFKKATATDQFGVASAEFSLADEVNFGTYHLRALMGDSSAPSNSAELALNVQRYVLPKFKVAVELTEKDNKPRRDYRPGDHVTGTVRANYFFGKPVDHAETNIKVSGMDVAVFEAASTTGKTGNDGTYHFDVRLPAYFAGRPLSQGGARALVEATVKDSAEHAETRGEPITISQSSLLITAVPEGGALIPHLENQIFLLSSYPDGAPASTSLTVHIAGARNQQVTTDSGGVAVIHLVPDSGGASLRVEADDHCGSRATADIPLQMRDGTDQVLLRTSRAIVKAGDRIPLKVLSTRTHGSAYIDIVRNGQTILTRDLDLQNGQADLTLTATPAMAGTLDIDAYLFGRDAQPIADHRLIFVQPADELKIEATTDAVVYKPGADARIRFRVTNQHGEGVSAALGLQLVDEAVFALAEKQPGFAKVFFYLEQEVMKPRYEIHSLSMPSVIEPADAEPGDHRDIEARALFSATEMATPAKLDTEFGRSLPQDKYFEYQQRYRAVFIEQVRDLAAKLSDDIRKDSGKRDIPSVFNDLTLADGTRPHDSWNAQLRIEPTGWNQGRTQFYLVRSAGPDRRFNSGDDLVAWIEARSGMVYEPGRGGTFDLKIEHDRGPVSHTANVTGTVIDVSGAIIPGATVTLRHLSSRATRTTLTNGAGRFTLAALPTGSYRAEFSAPGFLSLFGNLTVQAGDRAILSATLSVGSVSEAVMVEAPATPMVMAQAEGAIGGVIDGLQQVVAKNAIGGPLDRAAALSEPVQGRSFSADLKTASQEAAPHVRSYFPEALYIYRFFITDGNCFVLFYIV